ncbi:hypothetical protein ACQY0O_003707 [Thecaphora frezii]
MSVVRHLRPTALRALLLVLAGSFVRAMFPRQALDQFRAITADAAKQFSQERLHQPHQTDPSGSWHEQLVRPDVPFRHVDLPLEHSPAQGYPTYHQGLHYSQVPQHQQLDAYNQQPYQQYSQGPYDGQVPQHQQLDAYSQQPYHQYSQGPYDGQVPQHHQSDAYNQQPYHQGLVQHALLHGDQWYYSGAHQLPQSGYTTPASSLPPPPKGVKFGDPRIELGSGPAQDYPTYHQDLHHIQVSQHQAFGHHDLLYGYNEDGQPSNELAQGSSLLPLHYQDQGGEATLLYHPGQPQHYPLAYQPHHGQVHGAGPSHLPDQIQGNGPSDLGPESKALQGMGTVPRYEAIRLYAPVSMISFLGLDADGFQPGKAKLESLLKEQLRDLTDDGVNLLFHHKHVVRLGKMTGSLQAYFADEKQRKTVFNIIMQRMLTENIEIELIHKTSVLKGALQEETMTTTWMRKMEERERRIKSSTPLDERSFTPLNVQWQSSSGVATFDLNEYRIVIGRKKTNLKEYYAYQVAGLWREAPNNNHQLLFLGNFAAPRSSNDFIGSKPGRVVTKKADAKEALGRKPRKPRTKDPSIGAAI